MSVSSKDIQKQLNRIGSYIEQLSNLIDERSRLVEVLQLTPSQSDNLDLINLLAKLKSNLLFLESDISGSAENYASKFSEVVDRYKDLLERLEKDPYVEIDEYKFSGTINHAGELTNKKSVRFKEGGEGDSGSSGSADDSTQLRNQLMGTSANFKPYRDEAEEGEDDRLTISSVNTTNEEHFAQHQQQLLAQDESLDRLHDSIRIQHSMGLTINDELDEHLVILNDLERGVDSASNRLTRATNNIRRFRRRMRENGSLVTIVILTIILILLLVVLN
ncbi:putative syntaxin protein [Clavispora lusitaniae]|uniref:t-SNARE coiled-coil homology domain-containing protein n=3 Tax=Clavispora lusitaniae TaxID=36911 RepID=C4Y6N3_CLAL4|nr:uncharacterized protein CLUG_03817 [Clavispora lusitaniae ATCC 42720]KAF7582338.1 SNARE domain family protein [Clavispora lusitaniae]EEQ39689.1 hypothetical protein CLUG_03817 [Clavispora lusitaniae ATCC 42720]OVF10886.1 putative syntaxin [Clavispora lusitaniae]QFZ28580.1 putative syntaxin protein [Clavispora lusitaniae]QFZ34243.1 putative syntaxin protein [Clavispora lusitaniae]